MTLLLKVSNCYRYDPMLTLSIKVPDCRKTPLLIHIKNKNRAHLPPASFIKALRSLFSEIPRLASGDGFIQTPACILQKNIALGSISDVVCFPL